MARAIFVNLQYWKQKTYLSPEKSWKVPIATLDRVWRICRFSQSVQKKVVWFQTDHIHLKHNSFDLLSHDPPWHELYLFHILASGRYVGRYPFNTCCVTGPTPNPSPSLLAQAIFEPKLLPLAAQTFLKFSHSAPTCLWRGNRQSAPKRRHIKFRRRGTAQKKTYNHFTCLLSNHLRQCSCVVPRHIVSALERE